MVEQIFSDSYQFKNNNSAQLQKEIIDERIDIGNYQTIRRDFTEKIDKQKKWDTYDDERIIFNFPIPYKNTQARKIRI